MKRFILPLAGLAMVTGYLIQPLASQTQETVVLRACDSYDKLADQLGRQFDEAPTAFGLQVNGHLLQVFVSEATGTWTIVTTAPGGVSCIVAAGESWETLPPIDDGPMA